MGHYLIETPPSPPPQPPPLLLLLLLGGFYGFSFKKFVCAYVARNASGCLKQPFKANMSSWERRLLLVLNCGHICGRIMFLEMNIYRTAPAPPTYVITDYRAKLQYW